MLPKWLMQNKYIVMCVAVIITGVAIYAQVYLGYGKESTEDADDEDGEKEGFDTVPLTYDPASTPSHKIIAKGYYQVDETTMAKIPYGYQIDPNNPRKIIAKTNTAMESTGASSKFMVPDIPAYGVPIPDGYYKVNDSILGILPANMMPDVSGVDVDYTSITKPVLKIYYNTGYVSSAEYYQKEIAPENNISPPPPQGIYFSRSSQDKVSFLPYGKIHDASNGWGYVDNPDLISRTGNFDPSAKKYSDMSNNYDVTFHASAEDLMKNNDSSEVAFNQVRVLDQTGNVVILTSAAVQSPVTYYQPGSYPFGSSSYIPMYEDSVYLSRLTQQPTTAPYQTSGLAKGKCELNKDFPDRQEEYCRTQGTDSCASNTCCVLMGGEKCVAGNETGPLFKANYSDFMMRNKDKYYWKGKCHGNC